LQVVYWIKSVGIEMQDQSDSPAFLDANLRHLIRYLDNCGVQRTIFAALSDQQ
jgi:hypothetical protein